MVTAAGGRSPNTSPDWLPPGIPASLGLYELVRRLGQGGIGMVFEGRHRLLGQRVAVKVLHPGHAAEPRLAARFLREMAAFGRVPEHPNLVRAQYAGEDGGVLFLVMDYIDGADLSRTLTRRGPFPAPAACDAVRQALVGLGAIHRAGLVHRDLKPANLILARGGVVKILDLGLSRLREPDGSGDELTPSNVALGTFDYQAPEQAADPRAVDIRADVYSLGCTLYKLLTGSAPFADRATPGEKIHAHASVPFPALGPGTPDGLAAVLARMTAKAPADRFATPAEAAEALAAFADPSTLAGLTDTESETADWTGEKDTSGFGGSTPAVTTREEIPTRSRSRWRYAAPGLVLVAAVAVGSYFASRPGDRDEPNHPVNPEPQPAPGPAPVVGQAPAADVRPAGTPPRDLDALAPFEFHDLLDRPPVEAYWDKAGGLSTRTYEPRQRHFRIDSQRDGLFHLGTIHRPSYSVQFQIQQTRWKAGVGVYFGFRPDPAKPGERVFQYLMFVDRNQGEKTVTCVTRGRGWVVPSPAGGDVLLQDEGDQTVATPRQACSLSFEVQGQRLAGVRLNFEQELKRLVAPNVAEGFAPADFAGEIGFLTKASSCVFTEARLKITSER